MSCVDMALKNSLSFSLEGNHHISSIMIDSYLQTSWEEHFVGCSECVEIKISGGFS